MKNNKNKNYVLFERKLFYRFFVLVCSAIVFILLLSSLIRGWFGDLFVFLLRSIFHFTLKDALTVYQQTVRNNLYIIILVLIIIFVLIIFRILISWITTYFDEINNGIVDLINTQDKEIILSPEMHFIETKLNHCRGILEKRDFDAKITEQQKNDLVMYLAHDIKTPLTSVIGYLELLAEAPDMPANQVAKYTNITLQKANRLEQLINEFFEITRFNLNSIILNKSKINFTFMIQQIVDEFYPLLINEHKEIETNIVDDIILLGDGDKLSRVFNNIIKNAIAYSYSNSIIKISAQINHDCLIIEISNYGKQIATHQLSIIFEKFYRLDSSRSTATGGAGLGLAIAKEIVEAHHGSISATSDETLTTFKVSLPYNLN